jgi:protein SCO1
MVPIGTESVMADSTRIFAAAAALVAVGFVGWMGWEAYRASAGSDDPFAACRGGQVAGGAIGGPFTLIEGATGKTVTEKDVITRPTLVYFGYTFCPDVCPFDMSRNAEVADILEEKGMDLGLAFITVDPARDTAQVVADFAFNIHPKAVGLTGSPEQIKAAANAYKAYFKVPLAQDDLYLVDHSPFTYLMLPDHGFMDFYKNGLPADQMAESVACFLSAAEG